MSGVPRPRLKRPRSPSSEVQAYLNSDDRDVVRVTGLDLDYLPRTAGCAVIMEVSGRTRQVDDKLSTTFDLQCSKACDAQLHGYDVWCSTDCAAQAINVRATALLGFPVYGAVAIKHNAGFV